MGNLKIISFIFFILIFTGFSSFEQVEYNNSTNNFLDTNVNIKDAIDYALSLLNGEIIKAEKKFKKDILIWKINMITPDRSSLALEISDSDLKLIRIEAPDGPFDYFVQPDSNLISFSDAKKIAEDISKQKTLKWNFSKVKDRWEYNFWLFTKSGRAQVRLDAETGELITGKRKKK